MIDGFEIIGEIAAAVLHLSRFEPVHVIVNVAHPGGKLLVSGLQTRQTLHDASPLTAGKQCGDFAVFTRDWTQNRIRLNNKHEQLMAKIIQRHFFLCRRFALGEFGHTGQLGRPIRFGSFHLQQFTKTPLAFDKRE